MQSFKASKTLSGIETEQRDRIVVVTRILASKPLKPFQGLKLISGIGQPSTIRRLQSL